MARRIRLRPTYSSVMSTLALFLAMGGGAYAAATLPANSVGSRQMKRNAVVRAKIRSDAVDSSKVAQDALTGADIKEATLAKVPAATAADSAVHASTAAALDKLSYRTAAGSAAPQAYGTATAACDAGQHVTGGGVHVDDPTLALQVDGYPDAGGTAWTARVWNDGAPGGSTFAFTAYAVCTGAAAIG